MARPGKTESKIEAVSTPEQEAKIAALLKANEDLTKRKLALYSGIITLGFPEICMVTALQFLFWRTPDAKNIVIKAIDERFTNANAKYDAIANHSICQELKKYDTTSCLNEMIQVESGTIKVTGRYGYHAADLINDLKNLINDFTALFVGSKKKYLGDLERKSIKFLVERLNAVRERADREGHQVLTKIAYDVTRQVVKHAIINNYARPAVITLVGGFLWHRFIVKPIVFRAYKFAFPLRLRNIKKRHRTRSEAEILIKELEALEKPLQISADKNIQRARGLVWLLIVVGLTLMISGIPMIEAGLALVLSLSIAFNNKFEDRLEHSKQKALREGIPKINKFLNEISLTTKKGKNLIWEPYKKHSLETSYFFWRAKKYETKEGFIQPFIVCQMVKDALIEFGCGNALKFYGSTTLIVHGNIHLNIDIVNKINLYLQESVARYLSAKKLQAQLNELASAMGVDLRTRALRDEKGLHIKRFTLSIPEHFLDVLKVDELIKISPKNKFDIVNKAVLEIEGFEQFGHEKFKALISQIKSRMHFKPAETKITQQSSAIISEKLQRIPKGYSEVAAQSSAAENKSVEQKVLSPARTIKWQSATHTIGNKNSEVVPYSNKSNRFFIFKLKAHDFPDGDTYAKFKAKVERQKIAGSKGCEGWRFYKPSRVHDEQDTDGNWFPVGLDIKILGSQGKGNMRLYGEKEKSTTGETLYVVKGINLYAH